MMEVASTKYDLLKKASKTMFMSIAIAAAVSSFALVSIKSISAQISFNNDLIAAKEEVRDTLNANLQNISELKSSLELLDNSANLLDDQGERKNSAVILDALPIKGDLPALNTFMQNLAKETGVELEFSAEEFAQNEPFSAVPEPYEVSFNLTIKGDYDSIGSFLTAIDQVIRPLKINEATLTGSDELLDMNLVMSTYYQPAVLLEPTYESL